LEMWFSIPEDSELAEQKIAALTADVYNEYIQDHPNVQINFTAVNEQRYAERLAEGIKKGMVDIFESTSLDDAALLDYAGDLSGLIDDDNVQNCYFLSSYTEYFPDQNQLPMSVQVPMLFVNTALSDYGETGVSDLELLKQSAAGSQIAVAETMRDSFLTAFGEGAEASAVFVSSSEGFIAGEYAFLYSSQAEYDRIQSKMSDKYAALSIEAADVQYSFANVFSINKEMSTVEKKAAVDYLNNMLGDSAQDYMHSRYLSMGLPVDRKVADNIKSGNAELAPFIDKIADAKYSK